jgi:hypothetical protein
MANRDAWLSKSSDDDALSALERSVAKLLAAGELFAKAVGTRLICKNEHATTALHAPRDGVCKECGEWLLYKSGPRDEPEEPLKNPDGSPWRGFRPGYSEGRVGADGVVYEDAVREEMENLRKTHTVVDRLGGTTHVLRRAAEKVVKSRFAGKIDSERILRAEREKGPMVDGKVLRPRGKRAPRIL